MAIQSPGYLGRFNVADLVKFKFTSIADATGAPATLAGTPVLSVYEEGNTTEFTTGVTLTADYDSKTGINDVVIDTSSGYTAGKQYTVWISTGTVSAVSHVGYVVGHFALIPEPANLTKVSGVAVSTSTAQLGVNVVAIEGSDATDQIANNTTGAGANRVLTGI